MRDKPYLDAVRDAMSAEEVSQELGINRMQVNRLTATLDLPCARRVGRSWVYWPDDVEVMRWQRKRPTPGQP